MCWASTRERTNGEVVVEGRETESARNMTGSTLRPSAATTRRSVLDHRDASRPEWTPDENNSVAPGPRRSPCSKRCGVARASDPQPDLLFAHTPRSFAHSDSLRARSIGAITLFFCSYCRPSCRRLHLRLPKQQPVAWIPPFGP
jgi:hypothetical protein